MSLLRILGNVAANVVADMYNQNRSGQYNPEYEAKVKAQIEAREYNTPANRNVLVSRLKYKDYANERLYERTEEDVEFMEETKLMFLNFYAATIPFIDTNTDREKLTAAHRHFDFSAHEISGGLQEFKDHALWYLEEVKIKIDFFD